MRLGTRKSLMATTQSQRVADAFSQRTGYAVELVGVTTEGDVSKAQLAQIGGTGVFVNRLRERLLAGEIDFAVHSLKDLPTAPPDGIALAAVPARDDPRDALCGTAKLADLPRGARVGTGSPRRVAQLRAVRPDLDVVPIRGNADTRLRKVTDGEYAAVVLAYAGLVRIGRLDAVAEVLDPNVMLPAPGQGALAVECRADRADLVESLGTLDDPSTRAAVTAERAVLAALEAGCSAPVGAYAAEYAAGQSVAQLRLTAAVISADGARQLRLSATGVPGRAAGLGHDLAARLLADGAGQLMGPAPGPDGSVDGGAGTVSEVERGAPRAKKNTAAVAPGVAPAVARGRVAPGRVVFVGAGPGDARLLTLRGAELLARADTVVLDELTTELTGQEFLRHCRPGVDVIDAADLGRVDWAKTVTDAAATGKFVVRLVNGDPGLFGGVAEEAAACAASGIPFEIVPGVSAATAVPMHAGIPLTDAAHAEVRVVDAMEVTDWEHIGAGDATLVILGGVGQAGQIAKALLAAGRPDTAPVALTTMGTTTEQVTATATLAKIASAAKGMEGPGVMVVGDVVRRRDELSWFESKPLFGWRVLVPRTKEQAASLSEQLRSYGAVPEEVPTISVEPPRTPQQMERAVKGVVTGRYEWIVFTSTNAVRAVRDKLADYGLDARAFAGLKIAAVGEQTAAALRDFGVVPDLVPTGQQSSEGLLEVWPPYDADLDPINRVLLPRADIATDTLIAGLTEMGWECDDVTAYRTVRAAPPPAPIREAIKGGGFDAVLFTSSSTVRNLIGIAGKPHNVTVIAVIGPQTAKTAEEYGLRVHVRADKPSVSALAEGLAEYGAKRRATQLEAGEPLRKPSQMRRGARRRK